MGQDLFSKPNVLWGAALAVTLAVLPFFKAPGLIWFCLLVFLLLWLMALIALSDEGWRTRTRQTLAAPAFKQVYRWVTLPVFVRLWHRLCAPAPARSNALTTLRAALTAKLLDRALLIAVLYPIFLPVLIWLISGQAGQLGSATFLPGTALWDIWPERAALLGAFVILLAGFAAKKMASASPKRFVRSVSDWLPFGAFAGAVAGAAAVAGAFAGAAAVAGAFAAAVGVAVQILWEKGRTALAEIFLFVTMTVALMAAAHLLPWAAISNDRKQVFLFLGLFPIVNALFDALSYAVTLALMRLGLRGWNPVLAAVADVFCALVLFLGVGVALTASLAAMNALAGTPILDLGALFATVRDDPASHLWVFLMLFSTALPTLVHFTLALLGAQALVPAPLRKAAVQLIDKAPTDPFAAVFAPLATGLVLTIPFALIGLLLWSLWHWGKTLILTTLRVYGETLLDIAYWIGAF